MFIVAMTLAIIAAMGLYALNIASTEIKTAGYVRQQTQAYYLSEFGVLASAQEVTGPKAQMYRDLMIGSPDTNCTSLYGIPVTAWSMTRACRRVGSNEIAQQWNPPANPLIVPWTNNASESNRGSLGISTSPDFYVEVTDPTKWYPPSGYGTDQNLYFIQFTVAGVGMTPLAAGNYISEGLQTSRARIVGGPVLGF